MATVAIYDGRCIICNTTRRIVGLLDWMKRVEFLDLHQQGEVEARYPQIDHVQAMGQIHVVADGGTRRMLRDLPLGLPLWALLHLPIIGTWLGPNLYKFIARNRYTINRLLGVDLAKEENDCIDGVCKIPTAKKG
jgi:predicted DCC family thiol-disulfide oxidoreductase YuxK